LAWRLIASTKALLAEDFRLRDKLCFDRRNLQPAGSSFFGGEPMKVVVAANTLRLMRNGRTFVLNLECAAPHRIDETGAAI
jgi:hypothetical protein